MCQNAGTTPRFIAQTSQIVRELLLLYAFRRMDTAQNFGFVVERRYPLAWSFGANTLNPGESQRWWLWWNGYPGLEVIGVAPSDPASEIQYRTPGMQANSDGSTTYFLTITNTGGSVAQYAFTGGTGPAWTFGDNTLGAGESQRWWFWWPGYPGVEIIGVQCITTGGEIDYVMPGMQSNADGSATYYLTITNVSPIPVEYRFSGFEIC